MKIENFSNMDLGDFFHDLVLSGAKKRDLNPVVTDYVVGVLTVNCRMDEVFVKGEQQNLFRPMGEQYLNSLKSRPRVEDVKDIGDTCLILAGLFREFVKQRGISVSYYSDIGRGSYSYVCNASRKPMNKVFMWLAQDFDAITDILYTISQKVLPRNSLLVGVN